MNNSKSPLPLSIDGLSGEDTIAEFWKRHFHALFNCVLPRHLPDCSTDPLSTFVDVLVTKDEIKSAIRELVCGKASGIDGIFAEHLKYSSDRFLVLLSICLTCFFVHGAMPDSLIDVVLVPVIKDKSGKITSSDNYRPILLLAALVKLLRSSF